MPIKSIRINNFKSLKKIYFTFNNYDYDIHCLLGKNGTGKSNFLDAIKYFYDNLTEYSVSKNIIDNSNPYIQCMEISIVYDLSDLLIKNTNQYIKNVLNDFKQYFNEDNEIIIKLTQYKDHTIKRFPNNGKLLKFIQRVFPFYLIDTRFINLQDWDLIWEIMSDLSQSTTKLDQNEIYKEIDSAFQKIYGEKYLKSLNIIDSIFKQENININHYDYIERYKSILVSRLGGSEFLQSGNKLNYYSDGLNSFNFLKLLFNLIPALADTGWKNPLLVIDEPEIGLHPQYVDKLVDVISSSCGKGINILLATHSPNLVCELIKGDIRSAMYRVSMYKFYTKIEKMNEIVDEINKPIFTVSESSCYFSNLVIFVEGTSEMQLLCHNKIKALFPILNKVHVYPFNSNNTKLRFINPEVINFNIPYFVIIDLDKILKFKFLNNMNEGFLSVKSDELINPLSSERINQKEQLLYYSQKQNLKHNTHNLRQYILRTLKKAKFDFSDKFYYINDKSYDRIIKLVMYYSYNYNVFPVKTTIEGVIITKQSTTKVINWIMDEKMCNTNILNTLLERDILISGVEDLQYRTTILRLICNGKFDNLQTIKEIRNKVPIDVLKKISELNREIGKKTDGWIIKFMDYYFDKYNCKIENNQKRRDDFANNFPELFNIVQAVEFMLK